MSFLISSSSLSKNCKPQFKAAKLLAALAIAGLAHHSMAAAPGSHVLPTGGKVVAGAATIATTGNTMNINQSSQRAVVNWSSFDVGSQATVNFNQPNSSAATLNYVNSASKSMINGAVNANGQVIFINNNGIVFGSGAQINVGGMVATTMNTCATEFMSGRDNLVFEGGNDGKIINKGNITGNNINSYIALMAPQVKNSGVITATMSGNNAIALVSGQKVSLKFSGSQLVNVSVDASVINSLISNKLLINAGSGQVIIAANAAQDLMGSIVRNTGVVSASDISTAGGKVTLIADTIDQKGVIEANSVQNTGGKVSLKGNNIALRSGSKTTATGATGGGDIEVGVNSFNQESLENSIKNNNLASFVTVESNAIIDTSAIQSGNGGRINIWSLAKTSVAGNLYARGGAQGGNGGFIETSSIGNVDINQGLKVDTSSPNGRSGRWVIDPTTLIIDSTAAAAISSALNTTSVTLDATGSSCSAFGASCTQSQTALIRIMAGADIYSGNTATSLSLVATGGQIDIDSHITAGAVYAVAQNINVNGSINTNGGSSSNIYLAGAIINILGNINSNGGSSNNTNSNTLNNINTTTANNRRSGNNQNTLNADGNNYITHGGSINIVASNDITIDANSYISANGLNGGAVSIVSTAGKVTVNGIVDALGKAGNAGSILIAGQVETNLINSLVSSEGLMQGGVVNLGQVNNLGNGTILAPPATAPPAPQALLTFVQDSVSAATLNINSITSNTIIIDSQTGINAPNGNIVVFGDQIQVNNSSISAANGMIVIGREGYSSGALAYIAIVSNSLLVANKVETSAATLGVNGNNVLAFEWLLDPTTVTITTGATSTGTLSGALADPGAINISTTDIQNTVNSGGAVIVLATGTITVSNNLTFNIASGSSGTLTLDNRATQGAGIIVNASIANTGAGTLNLSFYAGGKININNDNTQMIKTGGTTRSIASTNGKMNVTMQSFFLGTAGVGQGVYTANIYIYGNITTRGGFITLDGTGGSIATTTSGSAIAGETITRGQHQNGNVYLEYGTALNTLTNGSTTVTATSTGGNINITASKGQGSATGSFEQGQVSPIYSGGTVNLDIRSYDAGAGFTVSFNFIVFNRVSNSPINAVGNINVISRTTQSTISSSNTGAVNITSPWKSLAGLINIDNLSTGNNTTGVFVWAAVSGASGVNITNNSMGAVGINSSGTGATITSANGEVTITNTSTNVAAGTSAGIKFTGAVSAAAGVNIVNNSQSGVGAAAGIYSTAAISSSAGDVAITSTTTTGSAVETTSAGTISAATGINIVGASTEASALVNTYGLVTTLGAMTNTGTGGVNVQSTGDTKTGSITDSGTGGISITGGYGIAAGTLTGGTITAVGTLSDTGGGVISLSMAQPTATPGGTGSIEAAAGVTTTNASVSTNVAYSLRGGVMSTANSTVNNVNYRSSLAPIAISVALQRSYVTDYGVAYTDAAPQSWVKEAASSQVSFTGGGAFGANPDVNTILGSLSLASVGGATGIAANRVRGAVAFVTGDIISVYGPVTVTGTETYTVRPATLTITSRSVSSVYDAVTTYNTLTQAGYTVSGLIGTIGGAPTADAVASTTSAINVGSYNGAVVTVTDIATVGAYSVIESSAQGTNLGNYNINYVRSTFNVTPAPLTITAASDSKTYGATTTIAGIAYNSSGIKTLSSDGFSVSGLLGTDAVNTVTLTSSLGAIATANASATPYDITPSVASGSGLSNYTITYVDGGLTVNKAVLTITSPTMVYNGTTTFTAGTAGTTATVTGVAGQTFTLGGTAILTNANVLGGSDINSTSALTFSGAGSDNYVLPASIANVVITPAPLTLTLAPQTKVYDSTTGAVLTAGTSTTNGSYTISGFVGGQGAFITQTVGAYNSANASTSGLNSVATTVSTTLVPSNWTAYSSATNLSNYSLPTTATATGTITKASLAILANDVSTFVNTQPANGSLTYVVSGLVGTDTPNSAFSVAPAVALASDASLTTAGIFAGKVIPSVTAPNYNLTATPGTLTVLGNNAILVSVGTSSKVYGTYNETQVTAGNIQADMLSAAIVTVQYKPAVSGVVNFTVARNSGTGIWTATDGIAGNSASYTFTVTPTIPAGSYSTANYLKVGSYALVPANLTLTSSTANCVSCSVSYTSGALTITPAPLLATVTPVAMTYNASTAITSTTVLSGTGVFSGVPSNVSGVTTLTAGSPNAGLQTINNGGTLLSGPDAANFTVTTTVLVPEAVGGPTNGVVAPASATTDGSGYKITIAKASLVYTGVDREMVYTSTLQTNSGATLTSGTLYSTDSFTIGGYATGTNVITTNSGKVNDILVATAAGSTNANNYDINYVHGSLKITPATLTITATADTKTYGSTTTNTGIAYNTSGVKTLSADGYTVGGIIDATTISSVTLTSSGALAAANVASSPYAITPSAAAGTGLSNYTISYINGGLTINPAVLLIANASMVYNGTTTFAPGVSSGTTTFTGVNGQTVTLGGSATMTNGDVLGTSAINNTSGLTVLGVSSGLVSNYVLPTSIANVNITPAPLTYSGVNTTTVFNNTQQTNSGATITSGTLFGSDSFAISGYATKTDVSRVGNIPSGALSSSPDALLATAIGSTNPNNYTITYVQGSLTITPAPLTATVTPSALTYNGSNTITSSTALSGFVGGATDVTGATALTSGSPNAGAQTIINGGTTLTGNDSLNYAVTNTILASTSGGSANGVISINPAANGSGYTIEIARRILVYTGQVTTSPYSGVEQTNVAAALTSGTIVTGQSFTLGGYAKSTNVSQGAVLDQLVAIAGANTVAANYDIRYINGSLTITPLQLTVTMTPPSSSKVYDSTTAATLTAGTSSNPGSYAITGFISGEGAYITQATGTYNSANVANANTITATLAPSSWTATGSTQLSNYLLDTTATASATIAPAVLSITANNAATFVGVTPAASNLTYVVSGLVGTDTPTSAFTVNPAVRLTTDATTGLATPGTYTAGLVPSVTAPNYTVTPTAGTLTVVGNSILVVSVGTTSKVFGTYNQTQVENGTISKAAPTVTVGYCSNCSDAGVTPQTRNVVYLTVEAPTSGTTISNSLWTAYDSISGTTTVNSVTTNLQGRYNFTVTPTIPANSYSTGSYLKVGNYALVPGDVTTVSGYTTNYQGAPIYTSGNLEVTPLTLTFAAATPTQTYNGLTAINNLALTPTNLPAGITGITSVVGNGSFTSPNSSNAAAYTINNALISGADAANFVFASASGNTGVINKAALVYTGIVKTSVFNGTIQTNSGATLTSGTIATGESFTIGGYAQQRNVLATATPDTLSATVGANTLASNYDITYINGSLRITPAPLTATVTAAAKTYNGSNVINSSTVLTGFVGGATGATGITSLTAGLPDAGVQTIINGGTALSGTEAANYSVFNTVLVSNGTNGVASVNPQSNGGGYTINIAKAPITYTGADTVADFNGTLQTNAPATLTSGSVVAGQSFTISGYATGTYVTEMPFEELVATANAGTNLNNYAITFINGSLTINPAPLTISGLVASNKTYDGNTAAVITGTPVLAGQIFAGEPVAISSGTLTQGTFASPSVSRSTTAVSAAWDNFTLDNPNYYIQGPTQPLSARINAVLSGTSPSTPQQPAATTHEPKVINNMALIAQQNSSQAFVQSIEQATPPNYLMKAEMLYIREMNDPKRYIQAVPVPSSGALKFAVPDRVIQDLIDLSGENSPKKNSKAPSRSYNLLRLPRGTKVFATLSNGKPLPEGIKFNTATQDFDIAKLGDVNLPISVKLTLKRGKKALSEKVMIVTK